MMFLFIIMGSTHGRAPVGFAPIAIGLGLTLIHLVSIPMSLTHRSTRLAASDPRSSQAAGLFANFGCSSLLRSSEDP